MKDINLIALALFPFFVLVAFICYKAGERAERIKWNDLIEEGYLPKPGQFKRKSNETPT